MAIAAGALLFAYAVHQEKQKAHAEAERLLGDLGSEDEEGSHDLAALKALARAPLSVREAFLEEGLASEESAAKLRVHEQGLSVALSQIRFSDATALFHSTLLPALKGKPQENAAEEAMAFTRRWSLIPQLGADAAMSLASQLTVRIPGERQGATRDQLAAAVADLAPVLESASAATLAATVTARLDMEHDANVLRDDSVVLGALAPVMTPEARSKTAQAFVARVVKEHNGGALLALKPALAPLSATLDPKTAAQLAQTLMDRIAVDYENATLDPLVQSLRPLAAKTEAADAQRISAILLRHIEFEPDSSVLVLMTQAMAAFGDKAAAELLTNKPPMHCSRESLRSAIRRRFRWIQLYSMGVLNGRARCGSIRNGGARDRH